MSDAVRRLLPVFGLLLAACSPEPVGPVGTILISIDTLRADHLGAYGYARDTSPFLDSLAERGVVFERALAPIPSTLPSHASMLTGLYPKEHLAFPPDGVIPGGVAMLAEHFQEAGYVTAGFTDGGFMSGDFGFDRGFDEWDDAPEREGVPESRRLETILESGLDFVDSLAPDEKFFLFLHTYAVHDPYDPPPEYRSRYWAGAPPEGVWQPTGPNLTRFNCGHETLSAEERDYFVALYDAGIRYTDETLARFFERLSRIAPVGALTVVVTSDHGEEFLEHDLLSHAQVFHHNLHVPLVLLDPDLAPRRVPSLARLVDVTPTLLDLAGIEPIAPMSGRSLRGAIESGSPSDSTVRKAAGETTAQTHFAQASTGGAESLYLDRADEQALYQYVRVPFQGRWLTARGARFEARGDTFAFRALAYLEPRALQVEIDGRPQPPIPVDRIFRQGPRDEFQEIEIPLPDDGEKHVVRLYADSCAPLPDPAAQDCRCFAFHVEGVPASREALFEVRRDPLERRDVSTAKPDLLGDMKRRLDETNQSFRAAAESETRDLSPEVIERLRALGYL